MMTIEEKKEAICEIVNTMLLDAVKASKSKTMKLLDSGPIDVGEWDPNIDPMIIPRAIAITMLENEADQLRPGKLSYWHKEIRKIVNNCKHFV